jgi:hypothetical protein
LTIYFVWFTNVFQAWLAVFGCGSRGFCQTHRSNVVRPIWAGLIVLLVGSTATAATIRAGDAYVTVGQYAYWDILVDGSSGESALGAHLLLSIGDQLEGAANPNPALINEIKLDLTGYLFNPASFETPYGPAPLTNDADAGVANFTSPPSLDGAGLKLARVQFYGAAVGKWELDLSDLAGANFTVLGGASTTLQNGTITVLVPEPALLVHLLGLFGAGGFGLLLRRRRRRAA